MTATLLVPLMLGVCLHVARSIALSHRRPVPRTPLTVIRITDLHGRIWGHVTHVDPVAAWATATEILSRHPRWLAEPAY